MRFKEAKLILFFTFTIGTVLDSQAQYVPPIATAKVDIAKYFLQQTIHVDRYDMQNEWVDSKKIIRLPEMALYYEYMSCEESTDPFESNTQVQKTEIIPYELSLNKDRGIRVLGDDVIANFKIELPLANDTVLVISDAELHFRPVGEKFKVVNVVDPQKRESWYTNKAYWQAEKSFKKTVLGRQFTAFLDCHAEMNEFQDYFQTFRLPQLKSVRHFFTLNASEECVFAADSNYILLGKEDESPGFNHGYQMTISRNMVETSFLRKMENEKQEQMQATFRATENGFVLVMLKGEQSGIWEKKHGAWAPPEKREKNGKDEAIEEAKFEEYLKWLKNDFKEYELPNWCETYEAFDGNGDIIEEAKQAIVFSLWPEAKWRIIGNKIYFPAEVIDAFGETELATLVFEASNDSFRASAVIDARAQEKKLPELDCN